VVQVPLLLLLLLLLAPPHNYLPVLVIHKS
jgi:hypothetical protein